MAKLGDYDRWFKPCKCGHDSGRVSEGSKARCWHCGSQLYRDYSERALKPKLFKQKEGINDVKY